MNELKVKRVEEDLGCSYLISTGESPPVEVVRLNKTGTLWQIGDMQIRGKISEIKQMFIDGDFDHVDDELSEETLGTWDCIQAEAILALIYQDVELQKYGLTVQDVERTLDCAAMIYDGQPDKEKSYKEIDRVRKLESQNVY